MNKASILEKKIDQFWSWFVQMEGPIRSFFTEEEPVNKDLIIESMNNRVLDFGMFTWEIGPGMNQPYYFLISPNGDKERLQISRQIGNFSQAGRHKMQNRMTTSIELARLRLRNGNLLNGDH